MNKRIRNKVAKREMMDKVAEQVVQQVQDETEKAKAAEVHASRGLVQRIRDDLAQGVADVSQDVKKTVADVKQTVGRVVDEVKTEVSNKTDALMEKVRPST